MFTQVEYAADDDEEEEEEEEGDGDFDDKDDDEEEEDGDYDYEHEDDERDDDDQWDRGWGTEMSGDSRNGRPISNVGSNRAGVSASPGASPSSDKVCFLKHLVV